jgi:hypothetical protein
MKTTITYGDITDTYNCGPDEALRRHCAAVLYGNEDRWPEPRIVARYQDYCNSIGEPGIGGVIVEAAEQ